MKPRGFTFLSNLPQLTVPTLVFFLAFFLYVWLRVDPVLQYHAVAPVFFTGEADVKRGLQYPGGLLDCLAALLMQFYQFSWIGALMTTLVAWLICNTLLKFLRTVSRAAIPGLHLLPALFLILLQDRYAYPVVERSLGLLLVMIFVVGYVRLASECSWVRLGTFLLLSIPLYFLTAGQYLIFVISCIIYELISKRRALLGLALLFSGAVLPSGAAWYFVMHLSDAYLFKLPLQVERPFSLWFFGLAVICPLTAWAAAWADPLVRSPAPIAARAKPVPASKRRKPRKTSLTQRLRHPLAYVIIAALPAYLSFDVDAKRLVQIDYYSHHKMWPALLQVADRLQSYTPATIADINRALCHQNRLLGDMFVFPQKRNYELWLYLHGSLDRRRCMKASDILFELGQVLKSERMAGEALEINGYRPEVLKRLALINVLRGEPAAARLFLNMLAKTLFDRKWAGHYRHRLEADPTLSGDEEIKRIRSVMLEQDFIGDFTTEALLQQLLQRNPRNRMAFEYLMAYYLMTLQLEQMELNIPRLEELGYSEMPRHVEEGLLMHQQVTGKPLLHLGHLKINPQTVERFGQFYRRYMSYQDNPGVAQDGLRDNFGDSYWFFFVFNHSGKALTLKDLWAK